MKHILILIVFSVYIIPQSGWQAINSGYSAHFTDVHFVSSTTGYAVSDGLTNQMLKTTNGGENWSAISLSGGAPAYIDFFNANSGFSSTGGSTAHYTVNGGTTWYVKYTSSYPLDCSMSSVNNVVLVGSSGSIRRSTDQGSSFTSIYTGNSLDLHSIFFYNENYGWVCGNGAAAYYTTNGGVNWTVNYVTESTPSLHYMRSVYFISQATGWCVGRFDNHYSPIYKTTNGGVTWTQQTHNLTTNQLNSVFFIDINKGWAVGDGGVILYTTNGGTNWTSQSSGTTNNLREVFFVSSTNGIIVGDYSTILKTIDAGLPVELTSFTSVVLKNQVTLKWTTATEVNNYGFEIERAEADAEEADWLKMGFIEGNGNSNSEKVYIFADTPKKPGRYLYRLKQIDTDGQYEYSGTVTAEITTPLKVLLLNNYPNPFNPTTKISYQLPAAGYITITLYNTLGQQLMVLVSEEKPVGYHELILNGSALPGGVYFYRLQAGAFTETKKLLLLK